MTEGVLTPDRILDAAEQVLTRYGPQKTTVVDVARALGVSHGSVYRHFASKAALRDAVTERWLARVDRPLARIAAEDAPAPERLRRWFDTLIATKRQKARTEPELFATYRAILADSADAIRAHVGTLVGQIARIIADGIRRGEFAALDPDRTARALFDATARFHAPVHVGEWSDPAIDRTFDGLWALLVRGLAPDAAAAGAPKSRARRKRE
ncbi:MAG TPA: TetR family transcriptional regulator [Bauldia sp.]|nr:TetR family transcriptional regulator [Bauldia sp.]